MIGVKLYVFCQIFYFFFAFSESTLNVEHFEEKMSFIAQVFLKLLSPERRAYLNA